MLRLVASLVLISMLSSCASIISRRNYRMSVRSDAANAKLRYKDSTYALPVIIKVRRGKRPLALQFITPDTTKNILVRPHPSPAFLLGNLGWMQAAPIAYVLDLTSTKRFTYGRNLFLRTTDTSTSYPISKRRWQRYWARSYAPQRGQISLMVGIPIFNSFSFQPQGEPVKVANGCLGLNAGISYAYREHRSLALLGGTALDFPVPFPVSVHYSGLYERQQSTWLGLIDRYHFARYSIGYGLCSSRNTWSLNYGRDTSASPGSYGYLKKKTGSALGIMAGAWFRANKVFNFGLQYRSSMLNLDQGNIGPYEHVISFELNFPINMLRLQ